MKTQKEDVSPTNQQKKPKRKKKDKIAKVYGLHQKGLSVKEIAEKMNLKESLIRSYIWRMKHPEKYKALVKRYFERKRQKQENDAIKAIVNNHQTPQKEEVEQQ